MVDRSVEIRVGIVIVAAMVLLVAGLLWLTETQVRDTGYTIDVVFPTVSGVKKGDAVEIGGVVEGHVASVTLRAQDVIATLWLSREAKIRRDARVSIESAGMMGEKFISIGMGSSPDVVKPGDVLSGTYSNGLADAGAQASEVLASLQRILANLELIVGDEEFREGIKTATRRTSSAMANADTLLDEVRPEVVGAARDLSASARELRGLLEENRGGLGRGIEHADRTLAHLDSLATSLAEASAGLARVVSRIEAGEGTLGKLTHDDELHDDLAKTVKDLNQLILDIRANPKKYLKISVF